MEIEQMAYQINLTREEREYVLVALQFQMTHDNGDETYPRLVAGQSASDKIAETEYVRFPGEESIA